MLRCTVLAAACLVVSLLAAGCQELNPPHVMVVMMENQGYDQVIGNPAMPFTNSLATQYGVASQSYACSHGSLANYIEITSGACPTSAASDPPPSSQTYPYQTIADQLSAVGDTAQAYAENLPADPSTTSGLYDVGHNPWAYYPDTHMPMADASGMMATLNSASAPDFVWYTPNIVDDGHTGQPTDTEATELAGAESFLSSFIPEVQSTSWYQDGGQIIIEWDEALDGDSSGINGGSGGHVPTIVVSKFLAATPTTYLGSVSTAGILHSIEHIYGVSYLGDANVAANGNIDPLLYW
ncbi:MAG: alkaline phosphatase family protein [Acidimicrobiales bacterium]